MHSMLNIVLYCLLLLMNELRVYVHRSWSSEFSECKGLGEG